MSVDLDVKKIGGAPSLYGSLEGLELVDLIDASGLQDLMEDFYAVAHIPMSIIDLKGRILVGVGWQQICTQFHRVNLETAAHCLESDTELSANITPGSYRLYKCKNNLWDIATPVIVGGRQLGNIFSGQFFFEEEVIDREFFRTQARQYNFDEEEYLAALDRVPRLRRESVNRGMAFLLKLADMISKQGYNNVELARLLAERGRLTDSLQRAQEIAHLGSWELDLTTNALHWSDEVYRIFGLEPQEFGATYQAFLEHVHPDDRMLVDGAYSGSIRENSDTYEIEHRVVRETTREVRIVHERCQHFRDRTGRIVRSVGMVHDITERKQLELELRALNEALEMRVRERTKELQLANQEMESFSYTVSHDLKAPLRVIGGFAELLGKGAKGELTERQHEAVEIILKECRHAEKLIQAVLEFSRLGRKELHTINLDTLSLVKEVLAQQRHALGEEASKDIRVELGDLPVVQADPLLMRQVFANLLSNAFKFTHGVPEPTVRVEARQVDHEVVFSVSDNGVGFPQGESKKLFSVFQRLHTQQQFEGTGIGLANVRRIIERHGGWVLAEGEEGTGARFYFALPVRSPSP